MPKTQNRHISEQAASDPNHVLRILAELYCASFAGRTGKGQIDFQVDRTELFRSAYCEDGEARALAEGTLEKAERSGLVVLERHARDPGLVLKVRVPLEQEEAFFDQLELTSPSRMRARLESDFKTAAGLALPAKWQSKWQHFFLQKAEAARFGSSILPFSRTALASNQELIDLLRKLLHWEGESLKRFASCVLCGDSKRLEALSARLSTCLDQMTGGEISSLESLGIIDNPRFVPVHGPLTLRMGDRHLDLGLLQGPVLISGTDLEQAEAVTTKARRCLTIENETTFHELAKLQSGELLVQTSYPGSATVQLLQRLPPSLEFWHFGDADVEGFDILHSLRLKTGRAIRPFQMHFRPAPEGPPLTPPETKRLQFLSHAMPDLNDVLHQILHAGHLGAFEQEMLGRPPLRTWPFFP